MQIERLEYFIEAAQSSSLTEASKHCNVTQQTISVAIQELENILNTTLFIRSKSGIQLTEQGNKVYLQVKQMLDIWNSLTNSFSQREQHTVSGTLKFLCPTTLSFLTSEIIQKFSILYPNVNILVEERFLNTIPNDDTYADILIYIVDKEEYSPDLLTAHPSYHQEIFFLDSGAIMVSKNSPYSKYKFLPKKALSEWPWIFFDNKVLPSLPLYSQIFNDKMPATYINTNNYHTYMNTVVKHNYAALTTNIIKKSDYYHNQQIHLIQLRQKIYGYYIIAIKKEYLDLPFVQEFLNILHNVINP